MWWNSNFSPFLPGSGEQLEFCSSFSNSMLFFSAWLLCVFLEHIEFRGQWRIWEESVWKYGIHPALALPLLRSINIYSFFPAILISLNLHLLAVCYSITLITLMAFSEPYSSLFMTSCRSLSFNLYWFHDCLSNKMWRKYVLAVLSLDIKKIFQVLFLSGDANYHMRSQLLWDWLM